MPQPNQPTNQPNRASVTFAAAADRVQFGAKLNKYCYTDEVWNSLSEDDKAKIIETHNATNTFLDLYFMDPKITDSFNKAADEGAQLIEDEKARKEKEN